MGRQLLPSSPHIAFARSTLASWASSFVAPLWFPLDSACFRVTRHHRRHSPRLLRRRLRRLLLVADVHRAEHRGNAVVVLFFPVFHGSSLSSLFPPSLS